LPIIANRCKSSQISAAVAIVVGSHLERNFVTTGRLQSACFSRRRPHCRFFDDIDNTVKDAKKSPPPRLLPSPPPTGATMMMKTATKMAEEGSGRKEEEEAFGL